MENVIQPWQKQQEQEVLLSRKTKLIIHSPIFFYKFKDKLASIQKHFRLNLDSKL